MIRICAEITADCFAHLLLFESRPYGGHFGHEITKGIIISTLRFFAIPVVLPWEVNLPSLVTHLRPLGQKSNIFRHLSPSSVPFAFLCVGDEWQAAGQMEGASPALSATSNPMRIAEEKAILRGPARPSLYWGF